MRLFDDDQHRVPRGGGDWEQHRAHRDPRSGPAQASALGWARSYWLHPLPPSGPLVLGCHWPDRGIPETLVELDPHPLLAAAATSRPVWERT